MAVELLRGGLHLSGTALWLDATRKTELSFVSHAHSDHIARHARVIATAPTVRLMTHRLGKLPAALPVPYNRPFDLGPLNVELLPAGHILGSAQIRVTREDGQRVVYTGDLNFASSLTAEPAQVAECDTLVIESTFGHPRYVFPDRKAVWAELETWVRGALDRKVRPILLGYALGKSQEAARHLANRGFALCVHSSIADMLELYGELGVEVPKVRRFDGEFRDDEVGIFPPHLRRGSALARVSPKVTAVLTGWALDPGVSLRYGADAAFPVSDHADFPSLVRYAKQTGASQVLTCHGFAEELAKALRAEGVEARPVGTVHQLTLPLGMVGAEVS